MHSRGVSLIVECLLWNLQGRIRRRKSRNNLNRLSIRKSHEDIRPCIGQTRWITCLKGSRVGCANQTIRLDSSNPRTSTRSSCVELHCKLFKLKKILKGGIITVYSSWVAELRNLKGESKTLAQKIKENNSKRYC